MRSRLCGVAIRFRKRAIEDPFEPSIASVCRVIDELSESGIFAMRAVCWSTISDDPVELA